MLNFLYFLDSRYTSLPAHFDPIATDQSPYVNSYMSSVDSNAVPSDSMYLYNPEISTIALQNISLAKFNELGRINEEEDIKPNQQLNTNRIIPASSSKYDSLRRDNGSVLDETEAKLCPMDSASVISEQVCFRQIANKL